MTENHHVPLGPPCPVEQTHAVCKGPQQSRRTSFVKNENEKNNSNKRKTKGREGQAKYYTNDNHTNLNHT